MDTLFPIFAVLWVAFSLPAFVAGLRAERRAEVPSRRAAEPAAHALS